MIRALAKHPPHPLLMRIHHRYQLAQQSALAREVSSQTGLPLLEMLDLSSLKTSDAAFVLGSGLSISEISGQRWEIFGRYDAIALNFWPVHPFVPLIYMFENIERVEGYEFMFDVLRRYLNRRAGDYRNDVKVVSELRPPGTRQLVFEIPETFRPNLYIGYSAYLAAQSEQELIAGIRFLQRQEIFQPRSHLAWHFKNGGSVTDTHQSGSALGLPAHRALRRRSRAGRSIFVSTLNAIQRPVVENFYREQSLSLRRADFTGVCCAPEVIYHFKQQVFDPAGIELFVENRSSTLFPLALQAPATCSIVWFPILHVGPERSRVNRTAYRGISPSSYSRRKPASRPAPTSALAGCSA